MATPASTLQTMMLIRAFETALAARRDHGFQLLSTGEEGVAAGLCGVLQPEDQLLTGGRSIGPALARGLDPARVLAELLGKQAGTNRGKGGRGHLADPDSGFFGAHAVVAGNLTIAAGVALARQMEARPGVVVVLFGDGASGAGALHESLNIAALWRLPMVFVCNNNQLSVSTARSAALAPAAISDLALAYRMPAETVDGMDVVAVAEASGRALDHARRGDGPAFLECVSHRFASHSTTARETRSADELASIRALCPIARYRAGLIAAGVLSPEAAVLMEAEAAAVVAAALAFADDAPYPDAEEALTDVY
jgi:TPP-dependent pyruvate/acetoin dehydrogenase alpha subunit